MGVPLPDDAPCPSTSPLTTSSPPPHSPPPPAGPSSNRLSPPAFGRPENTLPPWRTPIPLRDPILPSAREPASNSRPIFGTYDPSQGFSTVLRNGPSPPPVPFDAPAAESTTAWSHWLDERRQRRASLAAASATVGLPPTVRTPRVSVSNATSERLDRLRQSAERLRSLDRRVDEISQRSAASRAAFSSRDQSRMTPRPTGTSSSTAGDSPFSQAEPFSLTSSLDSSRQLLEQVRRRLDETRQRVDQASERAQQNAESLASRMDRQAEEAERLLADSRERVEWGTGFIERLEQLIRTLTTLSERAAAFPTPTEPSFSTTPIPPWRLPSSSLTVTSSSTLETPSSAAATDSLRHTVRQLIAASRRVSAAIDRHRDSITAVATRLSDVRPAESASHAEEEHVPLLRTDVPLPVSIPSRPSSPSSPPRSSSSIRPVNSLSPSPSVTLTSPNPSGLLLPTATGSLNFPLTASPRPISPLPPGASTASSVPTPPGRHPEQESYPGERAQLLRIAQLQRDIADRAGELRELRARTQELEREQRRESWSGIGVGVEARVVGEGDGREEEQQGRPATRRSRPMNPWAVREEVGTERDEEGEVKEEEEEEENEWNSLQREIEEDRFRAFVRSLGHGADAPTMSELVTRRYSKEERRRRDYEVYSRCGR